MVTQHALHGTTTDDESGQPAVVKTEYAILPQTAIQSMVAMVQQGLSHISIDEIVIQNGLTTSQVCTLYLD